MITANPIQIHIHYVTLHERLLKNSKVDRCAIISDWKLIAILSQISWNMAGWANILVHYRTDIKEKQPKCSYVDLTNVFNGAMKSLTFICDQMLSYCLFSSNYFFPFHIHIFFAVYANFGHLLCNKNGMIYNELSELCHSSKVSKMLLLANW